MAPAPSQSSSAGRNEPSGHRSPAGTMAADRIALSAHRFLHERADPCLVGGGQPRQSEGGRPHAAFVEMRLVAEAERRVPGLELLRALVEADDLAVLGVRGHPVPESRRETWRARFDDGMEPLALGAIRFLHRGDLREHGAFLVRFVRARAAARGRLQLLDALLHRESFLLRESLELLLDHGGALGGLPRVLLWAHGNLFMPTWVEAWVRCGRAHERNSTLRGDTRQPRALRGTPQCAESLSRPATKLLACVRSEEHTSELQSRRDLVCRLLLEKKRSEEADSEDRGRARRPACEQVCLLALCGDRAQRLLDCFPTRRSSDLTRGILP